MGCDIHIVVERRVTTDADLEEWICVDTLSCHESSFVRDPLTQSSFSGPVAERRNYRRFAALAGVRGEGPEPKGLPDDMSETTEYLSRSQDFHSRSYMSVKEAANIFVATSQGNLPKYSPCNYFFNVYEEEQDDHRIVFWFDN